MLLSHIVAVDMCYNVRKLTLDMILVPAGWLTTIPWKNKYWIKWSIIVSPWKTLSCMPSILFPAFPMSTSMIIILLVIRKDVPLYFHFTLIKIECPCHSYCPQGNISPQKYFKEFIYNIYTKLLNLVSLLVNCCKLRKLMN